MKKYLFFISFALCAYTCYAQTSGVLYVNPFANGQNNGSSWQDAFTSLHWALLMAQPGDQIWIAKGIYRPSLNSRREAYFDVKSGIQLLGGFAGTETSAAQRDYTLHQTIIDGNLGNITDSTDNSYNLMLLHFPDENTILDGLIFQHATASMPLTTPADVPGVSGAGLYIDGTDSIAYPLIRNCIFRKNVATQNGGGIYVKGGTKGSVAPRFWNCRFENNIAWLAGGAVYREGSSYREMPGDFRGCTFYQNSSFKAGGAIFYGDKNGRTDTLQLEACVFEKNISFYEGSSFYTSGRINNAQIRVKNCRFFDNYSRLSGTFTFETEVNPMAYITFDSTVFLQNQLHQTGTGFCCFESALRLASDDRSNNITPGQVTIKSCIFDQNKGRDIMVIHVNCPVNIERCHFSNQSNPVSVRSPRIFFTRNEVYNNTGFIDIISFRDRNAIVAYNVFSDNENVNIRGRAATFANNVFYNNTVADSSYTTYSVFPADNYYNNIFVKNRNATLPNKRWYLPLHNDSSYFYNNLFDFSDCEGLPKPFVCRPDNRFSSDPLFVDAEARDFRLSPCSPAIDAGLDQVLQQTGIPADIAGNPRLIGKHVDMGPYEMPLPAARTVSIGPACPVTGGSAIFELDNACGPYTYRWSNGVTTGTGNTGLTAGIYTFTVTEQRGYSVIPPTVSVPAAVAPVVRDSVQAAACAACATGRIQLFLEAANTPPYRFLWSNGDTTAVTSGLLPGRYDVTITDGNGCTYTSAYTISFDVGTETGYLVAGALALQPNPARDHLLVVWPSGAASGSVLIQLADMWGRVVLSQVTDEVSKSAFVLLSGVAPGGYVCLVRDCSGRTWRGRLVVI